MLSFDLINSYCQVSNPGLKDPLVYSVMDINDLEFGVELANAMVHSSVSIHSISFKILGIDCNQPQLEGVQSI